MRRDPGNERLLALRTSRSASLSPTSRDWRVGGNETVAISQVAFVHSRRSRRADPSTAAMPGDRDGVLKVQFRNAERALKIASLKRDEVRAIGAYMRCS